MRIWVDADGCPRAILEILFRAAERTGTVLTLVANRDVRAPLSPRVRALRVGGGFDAADRRIVELVEAGDLVVTADIPLAADVVDRGGVALDPRGQFYTADNVRERLATRDMMDQLRSVGVDTGGPAAFGPGDRQRFANRLDQWLTRSAPGES